MHILVVDDNRNFAHFLDRALATRGHSCRVVMSLADAIAAASDRPYEVFLIDLALPDGDGRDLAAALLAKGYATRSRIVFMTALERDAARDTLSHSTHGVLYKPFRLAWLVWLLDRLRKLPVAG